mmetsp:Transcript_22432/g.51059  ORF Transcript_22432/g.51059 Transcript_22432/m.51059 type:complete len:212 (-) Transcript_22432:120-755(-)
MPIKGEMAELLEGQWQIGMFESCIKAPHWCCLGCCCPACLTCKQRFDILEVTGEPYVCCGGTLPCGPLKEPRNKYCVCLEACCCLGCAISSNRYMIQTRFDRENTCCDSCLIWSMCCVSWALCILNLCGADVPDECEDAANCFIASVQGCMLAQQQREVEFVREQGYDGVPQKILNALPELQQEMIAAPKQQAMGGDPQYGAAGAAHSNVR